MLRLHKNENILQTLYNREIGIVCSPYKLSLSVLFKLVTSDDRNFQETWIKRSRKRMCQESGKLFINDFTSVYSLWGKHDKPSVNFSLDDIKSPCRVEDILYSPYGRSWSKCGIEPFQSEDLGGYYLVLFNNNWLHCYHFETKKLQKKVFIGNFETKFKHCDWDIYGEQITVMSSVSKKRVFVAVFQVAPLEFNVLLSVDKAVFGNHPPCNRINISDSSLIVGLGHNSNGMVRIYNFMKVLEDNTLFETKLGERFDTYSDKFVGVYPDGLPINCELKRLPPVLFEVQCSDLSVDFGGFPWHYIVCRKRRSMSLTPIFDVKKVDDHTLAVNGSLNEDFCLFPHSSANFHYDNSGRIFHVQPHSVNIYKLVSEGNISRLELIIKMGFMPNFETDIQPEVKSLMTKDITHKRKASQNSTLEQLSLIPLKTVVALDYEDELDLNVVLGFNPVHLRSSKPSAKINFYDNFTNTLVRSLCLPSLILDDCNEYDIFMELDTLIILVRVFDSSQFYKCHIFKLA